MARIWSGIFEKIGEEEVKKHFKDILSESTFHKFPSRLTKENIETTILSLNENDLKIYK